MSKRGPNYLLKWSPQSTVRMTERAAAAGMAKAAAYLEGKLKIVLSKPGPTKTQKTGTVVTARRDGKTITETVRASKPGEPPRRRTGTLRASIRSWKIDSKGLTYWVGTPVRYGLYLELGARPGLKPRPWLRTTLKKEARGIKQVFLSETRRRGLRSA